MIRFIDLRGQIYLDDDLKRELQEPIFTFFDTTVDQFVGWDQYYTWESTQDFATDFVGFGGWRGMALERFLRLIPNWAGAPVEHE